MGIERIQHNKEALNEAVTSLLVPIPEKRFQNSLEKAQDYIGAWKETSSLFALKYNPSTLSQNLTLENNLDLAFAVGFEIAGYEQQNGQDTYKYSIWREIQDKVFKDLSPLNGIKEVKNTTGENEKIVSLQTMRLITSYAAFEVISQHLKEQQGKGGWVNNPFLFGIRLLLIDGVAVARVKGNNVEVDFLVGKDGQEVLKKEIL